MDLKSFKSTTAILLAITLAQPLPVLAQSRGTVSIGPGHVLAPFDTLRPLKVQADSADPSDTEKAARKKDRKEEKEAKKAQNKAERREERAKVRPEKGDAAADADGGNAPPARAGGNPDSGRNAPVADAPMPEEPKADSPGNRAETPPRPPTEAPRAAVRETGEGGAKALDGVTPPNPLAVAPVAGAATRPDVDEEALNEDTRRSGARKADRPRNKDRQQARDRDATVEKADAPAAAAAGGGVPSDVVITTDTVNPDSRRSSSQEFDRNDRDRTRDADGDRDARDQVRDRDSNDYRDRSRNGDGDQDRDWRDQRRNRSNDGLSDLETAGLIALGAVVVGAILLNGQRVTANTGDRVIVQDEYGNYRVLKDDDALIRQPGSTVRTERFADGSTRSFVTLANGDQIVTIRDANGRVLRRSRIYPDGRELLLIDDTRDFDVVDVRDLPTRRYGDLSYDGGTDRARLRAALLAAGERDLGRSFSLRQVREIVEVRELAPEITLTGINFRTASAAVPPSEAEQLRQMGLLMREFIADNPQEVFLIEGHTDAVGDEDYNLLLSDRRAESVALALSEYFDVPPENMIVQGYGETFLKVPTARAERLNRRVAVRRITPLIEPY